MHRLCTQYLMRSGVRCLRRHDAVKLFAELEFKALSVRVKQLFDKKTEGESGEVTGKQPQLFEASS